MEQDCNALSYIIYNVIMWSIVELFYNSERQVISFMVCKVDVSSVAYRELQIDDSENLGCG